MSLGDKASGKVARVSASYQRASVFCLNPPYPCLQPGSGGDTTGPLLVTRIAALTQAPGEGNPHTGPGETLGPLHTEAVVVAARGEEG